jgi:hypothetical protein
MSLYRRHIKSQSTINYEEPYAFEKPTNATFIPTETMETNEKKESPRQTSQVVHDQRRLVENTKAEGQEATTCFAETMESETVGLFT